MTKAFCSSAASLLLAFALVGAGCGPSAPAAGEASRRPEPNAGKWKTWVLSTPDEIKVPPPPAEGSEETLAEEAELAELAGARTSADEEVVRFWDREPATAPWMNLAMDYVSMRPKDPPGASRAYGLVSVAMYDATVAAWHWKYVYDRAAPDDVDAMVPAGPDPSYPSEHAVLAGAASRVLEYAFPEQPAGRVERMALEAAESRVIAGTNYRSDVQAGLELGRAVADRVIAQAKKDGYHRRWKGKRPKFTGAWEPPPGSVARPVQPLAGKWDTWVMESGDQFRPQPPPRYGSHAYMKEAQALVALEANLTDEQKRIAEFWAGGEGTPLPPGIWNQVALKYVRERHLTIPRQARVFALINVAMADAGVSAWDAKYAYWTVRPENAIRDLGIDKDWKPYLETPFFPSYVSGHATYSGAVGEVMAHLFPEDAALFRAKAKEAAMSRSLGGIHFQIDNEVGIVMGQQIGDLVVDWAKKDGAEQ
ncbi:MAG TPA: vanadium-dependent haloperoxidase [Actinomycetota bacterium]|nr:vanadium-dependent haloperoxidase [Actinomycetota bacterium]